MWYMNVNNHNIDECGMFGMLQERFLAFSDVTIVRALFEYVTEIIESVGCNSKVVCQKAQWGFSYLKIIWHSTSQSSFTICDFCTLFCPCVESHLNIVSLSWHANFFLHFG